MKVLFLTLLDLEDMHKKGIYHDFVNELKRRGHEITVVSASEKRNGGETKLIESNGVEVLKVLINDVTKTSFVKKGVNTLLIERFYTNAIKRFLNDRNYDLIIYTTPPITFNNLVGKLKKQYNAKTYLLLKDIFPQNAVDLNLFKKHGPIYTLFRKKEKKLYEISDYIGGMSKANIDYIRRHNKIKSAVHIFRNAMYEEDYIINNEEKVVLFGKYNLDMKKKLFLYGGNLGIPQGAEYIKEVMKRFHEIPNSQLLIVGSGTHYETIKACATSINNKDIQVMELLPKEDYDQIVAASDIGLIFLDHRFTIPNYPSRLTGMLNAGKPILAATDSNTDIGKEIVESGSGLWNESIDVDSFIKNACQIIDEKNYSLFSKNAKKFFESDFKIEKNIDNLLKEIEK